MSSLPSTISSSADQEKMPSRTSDDDLENQENKDIEKEASNSGTADGGALQHVQTAQDWTGPEDPENPWNWPTWKRVYHTFVPAALGLAATFGSSAYVPGLDSLSEQMHISHELGLVGLSLWVVGLALGPVIAAPLSERFGRKYIVQASILTSTLFVIGSAVSTNPPSLLATRFFGGFFAGPVLSIGAGMIADVWQPAKRGIASSAFIYAPFAGPALGPLVGGFAAQHKDWQWTQWVIVMFEGAALLMALPMSETHKVTILKKRARKLRLAPPKSNMPGGAAALKMALIMTLFRPLYMLVAEPIVGMFSLYIAFNFSVLFAFFDAFPIVFTTVYDFDIQTTGLTWLSVLAGCTLGILTFYVVGHRMYVRRYLAVKAQDSKAVVPPEQRLYPAMIGSFGLPIGLFWLGWTARSDIHWISPVMAALPFAWGNFLVFNGCSMYLIDTYGSRAGASAMAANGLLRYSLGAVFPLFTTQMYTNLGIAWATSIFGFIAVLLLPIPWALYKFGPAVRRRSKYAMDI